MEPASYGLTATADLCDAHADAVQVCDPLFRDYGGVTAFSGTIVTVRCFEDNSRVRETLESDGRGRVLVVDAGGSLRCAMLGDNLAQLALDHGWAGVVMYGCVRDAAVLSTLPLGVKALATHPRKSEKRGEGEVNVPVRFGGVTFVPGQRLYADEDGVIVLTEVGS
jgi:regulator of ribonuclease activity A